MFFLVIQNFKRYNSIVEKILKLFLTGYKLPSYFKSYLRLSYKTIDFKYSFRNCFKKVFYFTIFTEFEYIFVGNHFNRFV